MHAKLLIENLSLVIVGIVWCELGYYYFVNYRHCSQWPGTGKEYGLDETNLKRILVVADPHIMGSIKSYKIDKLRREWQMKQTFRTSINILEPDVIFFIGDLLDEGYFIKDADFNEACEDFNRIFAHNSEQGQKQKRIVLPGNHDVGFHDHMTHFDYFLRRFLQRFQSSPYIERLESSDLRHLNLIVANSMMFYNDSCPFCSMAIRETNQLASALNKEEYYGREDDFASPTLLKHIPLYRKDDSSCSYPSWMSDRVRKPNVEGIDVLHERASNFLLKKLKPRLVISGHTHMECHLRHRFKSDILTTDPKLDNEDDETNSVNEITVSSYNHKYAELKPGYLLLSLNSTHFYTKHCDMIEEWVIISVYLSILLIILTRYALSK